MHWVKHGAQALVNINKLSEPFITQLNVRGRSQMTLTLKIQLANDVNTIWPKLINNYF